MATPSMLEAVLRRDRLIVVAALLIGRRAVVVLGRARRRHGHERGRDDAHAARHGDDAGGLDAPAMRR